ncbi:hypothetical protein ACIQC5_11545 [Paenarthrobacter sp. NPDC092416]|uniref:hypothetical protein n=1 Tax=Paenarthrobacter sp. NPDC092416 TaxID=3364386 RepID=UPI0038218BA6
MEENVELIATEDSLAVIGSKDAVRRFIDATGLSSLASDLELPRLETLLSSSAVVAESASQIAANSGMYLKLTAKSADKVKKLGLMPTKTPGVSYAMLGQPGEISGWVEVASGAGALMTNPAVLSGISGIMAQLSTQQGMAEISAKLATIQESIDETLRKVDDSETAKLVGIGQTIDRAMIIRARTRQVDQTLWSTVDQSHQIIATALNFALTQLGNAANRLDRASVGSLARAANLAEADVPKWLGVIARCFQLQDAIDILELDRRMMDNPEGAAEYALGMKDFREGREKEVSKKTKTLLQRLDAAADKANARIIWSRTKALELIESANQLGAEIQDCHGLLAIKSEPRSWDVRELSPVTNLGSKAVQKTKDVAPLVGTVAALYLAGAAAARAADSEGTAEEDEVNEA